MGGWGRDMMFNDSHLPPHRGSGYERLRRSSMVEHPRSEATVVDNRRSQCNAEPSPSYGITPIDISPRPNLPDRRSSLSATLKLRKTNHNRSLNDSARVTASSPISKDQPTVMDQKKSRLAMPRLFGRSESTPSITTPPRPRANGGRSLSYFDGAQGQNYEKDDTSRATPPPIKRNRGPTYRPSSAGEDAVIRKESAFGYDGAADKVKPNSKHGNVDLSSQAASNEAEDPHVAAGGKSRKWLGFGRTGSLRRT